MFSARVPGYGLVEWSPSRVDAYAAELRCTHLPAGSSLLRRLLSTTPEPTCVDCGESWPCPAAWWADRYQQSNARRIIRTL